MGFAPLILWLFVALAGVDAWGATIAVTPFTNGGGPEFEALGVGLQSMVMTDLAQSAAITVVERERLAALVAEIDLSQTKYVDKAAAVNIGKLVAATHLVTGSFTVVGGKGGAGGQMRLDGRVLDATTGVQVAEASATGEQEAFFELEKALVGKLVAGIGVALSPKERAAVAKIQTADFGAFSAYSEGLALADAEKYADAVRLLEQATRADPDFELASVTLGQIRQVQEQAAARSAAAKVVVAGQEFVARQAEAREQGDRVEELRAIAGDPARSFQDRATADLMLSPLTQRTSTGGYAELLKSADRFALNRIGERAFQALWADLRPKVPTWFPAYESPSLYSDRTLDEQLAMNRKRWFEGDDPDLADCADAVGNLTSKDGLIRFLWVPARRQLELAQELLEVGRACPGGYPGYEGRMIELAKRWAGLGEVARSTAIFDALAKGSTDPRLLDRIVHELDTNKRIQQALDLFPDRDPDGALGREAVLGAPLDLSRAKALAANPDRIRFRLAYDVRNKFPFQDPLFVGGLPVWSVTRPAVELLTGPRTAVDEARSVRHYRDLRRVGSYGPFQPQPPAVLVMGGLFRADVRAHVTVNHRVADDWWPLQYGDLPADWAPLTPSGAERPTGGFLFGLRELDTGPVCDPTGAPTPIPTTGWAAVVRGDALVLAEVSETWREADSCTANQHGIDGLALTRVLATKPLPKRALDQGSAELVLEVRGKVVTASAGGATVTATLGAVPAGFVALYADGDGYVELADPGWD